MPELINLQALKGHATPYQVQQFLEVCRAVRSVVGGAVTDHHINVFRSDEDDGYVADMFATQN